MKVENNDEIIMGKLSDHKVPIYGNTIGDTIKILTFIMVNGQQR